MANAPKGRLTDTAVNHFFGRKANQALYAKAFSDLSGYKFMETTRKFSSSLHCSSTFYFSMDQFSPQITVETYVYTPGGAHQETIQPQLHMSVSVDRLIIGSLGIGSTRIGIKSIDDLRNPGLLFLDERLVHLFDEAKKVITDTHGWVNEQVVALAFKTRDAMFKQAEEIRAATVEYEESTYKNPILSVLCRCDYRDAAGEARALQSYLDRLSQHERRQQKSEDIQEDQVDEGEV